MDNVIRLKIHADFEPDLAAYEPNYGREFMDRVMSDQGKTQWNKVNSHTMFQYTNNVLKNSRGFLDPSKMPTLEKLRILTGMDRCQLMILKYDRGETCLYHVDRMPSWDLINNPNDTIPDDLDDFDNHQYIRILVMPRNRAPGQYMQFGDIMLNDWEAGDAFYYRGVEVYHSAGACGYEPRLAIRITGLRTPKFDQFISCKDHYL